MDLFTKTEREFHFHIFCENMENEKGTNNIGNDTQYAKTCEQKTCFNTDKKLSELHPNLSKHQLKKVRKREKWLTRKVERRFLFLFNKLKNYMILQCIR